MKHEIPIAIRDLDQITGTCNDPLSNAARRHFERGDLYVKNMNICQELLNGTRIQCGHVIKFQYNGVNAYSYNTMIGSLMKQSLLEHPTRPVLMVVEYYL